MTTAWPIGHPFARRYWLSSPFATGSQRLSFMVASTAPLASLSQKLVKSRHCLHATELKCESDRTECEKSKQTVEKNDAAISAWEEQERKLKMQCACARTWFLAAAVDGDVSELRLPTYCPLTHPPLPGCTLNCPVCLVSLARCRRRGKVGL